MTLSAALAAMFRSREPQPASPDRIVTLERLAEIMTKHNLTTLTFEGIYLARAAHSAPIQLVPVEAPVAPTPADPAEADPDFYLKFDPMQP